MRFFAPLLLAATCAIPGIASPLVPVLPKGTPVRLRLDSSLRSGRDKVGQTVLFTVTENVYGPKHVLLLAKGAPASGHIIASAGNGPLRRTGKLAFTCDEARTADGTRIPLTLRVTPSGENPPAGGVVVGVVAGVRQEPGSGGYVSPGNFTSGVDPTGPEGQLPEAVYRANGTFVEAGIDPVQVLGNGQDAQVSRGEEYEAKVAADTPFGLTITGPQLFTLKDGTKIKGIQCVFDGQTYTVQTATGSRILRAADVESVMGQLKQENRH